MNSCAESGRKIIFRHFLPVICYCLLLTYSDSLYAQQDAAALAMFKQYIQGLESFSADFEQRIHGQSGGELEISAGIVRLQKPGKFYWEYRQPYRQKLISDGQSLWIYDEDLEQVTVNNIDLNNHNSPAALLTGGMDVADNYIVASLGSIDGYNWIELNSIDSETEFNTIRLGFQDENLAGMILFDNLGQVTQLIFSNIILNQPVEQSLFEFTPPDGIDIIDTRNN